MTTELMHFAQQWLAFSLVLSVQLLLILMLRKPVRANLGAVACYRLWLLPVAWLPLYFLGPFLLAALATADPVGGAPGGATPYQQVLRQFVDIELLPFNVDLGSTTSAAGGDTKFQGWSVLAVLWAAGTVALMIWHARRWLTFSREVRVAGLPLSAAEKAYTGTPAHFAEDFPILRLNAMNSAAIFGIFKPALLLPGAFTQRYDENQRHIILAHEAVHLRRGDNGWNLCALVLIALFWTNPLVYIAWRCFRLDQELSCDALALTRCNKEQQKRYARTLLDSLSSLSVHSYRPALSAWDNLGDIKERSLMVHHHMHLAKRPLATLASLIVLTAFGASLTIAFADLLSPVARAADWLRPVQTLQVSPDSQRAVQVVQQQLQEVQQGLQATRQPVQVAQQAVQVTEQHAQLALVEVQLTQQQEQEVQQDLDAVPHKVQEIQADVKIAGQPPSAVQRDVLVVQQQAADLQQDVQLMQQQIENTLQAVQETRQEDQSEVQQEIQQGVAALQLERISPVERSAYQLALLDPVPQARVHPEYPRRALALGLEGWVKVRYTVSETGSVVDPVVVASKPKRVFDNAALRAIADWRYDPAMEDAVAVEHSGMETTFRFTLADL